MINFSYDYAQPNRQKAIKAITDLLGAGHVLFTTGRQENIDLAVKIAKPTKMISTSANHRVCSTDHGCEHITVPCNLKGRLPAQSLVPHLTKNVGLVLLPLINTDTGIIYDVIDLADVVKSQIKALVFIDISAGIQYLDFNSISNDIELVGMDFRVSSIAPFGALWMRCKPASDGILQDGHSDYCPTARQLATLVKALADAPTDYSDCLYNRNLLEKMLEGAGFLINGTDAPRVCSISSVQVPVDGKALVSLMRKKGISISEGSNYYNSCVDVSPLMKALRKDQAYQNIRFRVSSANTAEEIQTAVEQLQQCVQTLKELTCQSTNQSTKSAST